MPGVGVVASTRSSARTKAQWFRRSHGAESGRPRLSRPHAHSYQLEVGVGEQKSGAEDEAPLLRSDLTDGAGTVFGLLILQKAVAG
jgi:hypothetical protein